MDGGECLYSVKMRASKNGRHVSGAERIVEQEAVGGVVQALTERALHHGLGQADFINLKLEQVRADELLTLPALPVTEAPASTVEEAYEIMRRLLAEAGVQEAAGLVELVRSVQPMRGAVLYDVASGRRLEPDPERGIRVTYMDAVNSSAPADGKNHFQEAVVLATKVVSAPGILAELCVSDDPDYVVGYIASKKHGYVRLWPLKEPGDRHGGRVFVYDSRLAKAEETIAFLEKQRVLVEGVPQARSCAGRDVVGAAAAAPESGYAAALDELRSANLYRQLRTMESEQAKRVQLQGRSMLLLSSNSYLDLASEPQVKQAAAAAALEWGAGSGGSRLTTGSMLLHEQLEAELARFKQTEAALLFNTGYMANVGAISALVGKNGCIFSDEYNHASIIDGCRLSGGRIVVYRHNDMADLESKLRRYACGGSLIVSDAVFSMDGDIVNLPELTRLGKKYGVLTMIDEAHATGVIGASGRGAAEHFGACCQPDITMGTLSKALGSEGGFVCAGRVIVDYLINRARSFIFSTAQCPAALGAALASLRLLQTAAGQERVRALQRNTEYFCRCLREQGVEAASPTAIVPVMIGGEEKALRTAQYLQEAGILIPAIRYPTVPKGTARLRAALMATHTQEELALAAQAVAAAIRDCG